MVFYVSMNDTFYMKRALHLAAKAKGVTSPNPMVGAVLVKQGKIIAEDYHRRPGTPHAEALVLGDAGEKARGATLYVNLEPCCHTEKRTPPCTRGIIASGIKKVVVAMLDPNPKVSGMGITELRKAGIDVSTGLLEAEAKKLNEFYIKHMTTGKPFVVLKIAMTLDGKIATPEGQSKWITGERARKSVHRLRSSVDAIMTAIGTVKADNPRMTARVEGGKSPLRIVIDPNLEISSEARILQTPPETIIVTNQMNSDNICALNAKCSVIYFKDLLDLNWLIGKLGIMGITSVLIEGGSSLNAHAIEDGIVDKIMVYIAPKIIGGKDSIPAVGGKTFRKLEDAYRVEDLRIKRYGEDMLIEGYIQKP
jgi:diaminohydroxyphosphoribosylaminopyrimidine deaminase / 5-amino-6-(5-phosphoribosylamino)uracil reductase